METYFSNLKLFRKQRGFTLEEIAEMLGVSRQAVAKWERGETLPDIKNCIKLAEIYETSIDMLVRNTIAEKHTGDGKHIFGCTKMNSKGQITLPVNCRKIFGINEGDNILVLGDEEKGIALVNLSNPIEKGMK